MVSKLVQPVHQGYVWLHIQLSSTERPWKSPAEQGGQDSQTSELAITRQTYDDIAIDYAHAYSTTILDDTLNRFATRLNRGERVLDVGCGVGQYSATLQQHSLRVVGIDNSIGMLRHARLNTTTPLCAGDMQALPYHTGTFGGLWASAAFLHIPRRYALNTLQEFRRTLRSNGLLYISVKQGEGERWIAFSQDRARFFTFYQPDEMDRLLQSANFVIVERWNSVDYRGRSENWLNRLAIATTEKDAAFHEQSRL